MKTVGARSPDVVCQLAKVVEGDKICSLLNLVDVCVHRLRNAK